MKETKVCGNCKYYQKRAKRSGFCGLHSIDVINTKKEEKEIRFVSVLKYHVCGNHTIKL